MSAGEEGDAVGAAVIFDGGTYAVQIDVAQSRA